MPDWLETTLQDAVIGAFTELAKLAVSPYSRTWLPVLAVSVLAAVWVARRERATGRALPDHLRLGSFETWFGRSAVNDYWLILLNGALFGMLLGQLLPEGERMAAWVADSLRHALPGFGAAPAAWAPVLLAATLFLVDDFVRYAVHWLEHRVPALWELHKVHHSAEVLNFMTAERHHPLSILVFRLVMAGAVAVANGVFLWAFGDSISPTGVLGANVFWLVTTMLASGLRHSPVWLSFGPRVERWLLSPAQHQIHHSTDERHYGKNLGGSLAIWDRMFGTLFVTSRERIELNFGLGDETRDLRSVGALYLRPIVKAMGSLLPQGLRGARTKQPGDAPGPVG